MRALQKYDPRRFERHQHLLTDESPGDPGSPAFWARYRVSWWGIALCGGGLVLVAMTQMLRERQPVPHPQPQPPPPATQEMVLISGSLNVSPFFLDTAETPNDAYADWLNQEHFVDVDDQIVRSQGEELLRLSPADFAGIDFEKTTRRYVVLADHGQKPVVWVSWAGARRYCQSRGKRLPTGAEWVAAAYGSRDERPFPWGEQPLDCRRAVFGRWAGLACPHEARGPAKVRSTFGDRTPEGVHDLGGNVAEWVGDDDARKGHRFFGGDFSRSATPISDKAKRVSHLIDANGTPIRQGMGYNVGFRCAQSLPPSSTAATKERS
ncbi:SUMF1/EgtB/PvdO family nonheme iron enzyme [Haliangium sp. UPWRP_2]|uniref:formylglycine-generating enzyme family protein n=1 Tax=Haliangium sp. UPWRP_2 TaxID=1931276 RepID=UPI001E49C6F6|nr:SUMF1/EgtB/PvdO family nonheme iron enzyme [Haliangium sp. UPWRP_2]